MGNGTRGKTRSCLPAPGIILCIAAIGFAPLPARAQDLAEVAKRIEAMRQELAAQRSLIDGQSQRIGQQQQEIERLRRQVTPALASTPADQPPGGSVPQSPPAAEPTGLPVGPPVGAAPDLPRVEDQVVAVPAGMGVLTRGGRFMLEPSLEYTNSSSDRLVFRGIELIPGIQVGLIEANNADRDTVVTASTVRYGLTDDLELEARVPFLIRSDRIEGLQQRDSSMVQALDLRGRDIGDVEFALRYQFNRPVGQRPIFVGSVRVKTDTGKSPFAVPFDQFGVATGLATGSGFWAVQPGLSFLLPSEPAVLFGGVSYLYHIAGDIDRTVGGTLIGRVDPGDAINANIGFGFALNPRFSFSLAYQHNYIFPMHWEIGGMVQRSDRLQVGSFALGMSYRLTEQQSLNLGFEIGATRDAPDVSIVLRAPFLFR